MIDETSSDGLASAEDVVSFGAFALRGCPWLFCDDRRARVRTRLSPGMFPSAHYGGAERAMQHYHERRGQDRVLPSAMATLHKLNHNKDLI